MYTLLKWTWKLFKITCGLAILGALVVWWLGEGGQNENLELVNYLKRATVILTVWIPYVAVWLYTRFKLARTSVEDTL